MKFIEDEAFRVLFICTGNVCRSPMAEAALRGRIPKDLLDYVQVASAGLSTFSGLAPTVEAQLAARLKGYDLAMFRSQKATEELLDQHDLILCMEPYQTQRLRERYVDRAGSIHTLKEFKDGVNEEIPDPYSSSVEVYQKTLDLIDRELGRIKTKIWELARKKRLKTNS